MQAIRAGGRSTAECTRDIIAAFGTFPTLTRPLLSGLVRLWEEVPSYMEGKRIMDLFDAWPSVPSDILDRIEQAYAKNDQLYGSVLVNRKYPAFIERMKSGRRPPG